MPTATEFEISPTTAQAIRDDIRASLLREAEDASSGGTGITDDEAESLVAGAQKVPVFVLVALKDNAGLVGVEATLKQRDVPVPKLQPLSLISAAIFLGEGSCHAGISSGPYIKWLPCP